MIYRQDTEMEFGIEKVAMLIRKSEKKRNNGRNRTTNSGKNQNTWEMENYEYLRILKADPIKQAKMKEKIRKE